MLLCMAHAVMTALSICVQAESSLLVKNIELFCIICGKVLFLKNAIEVTQICHCHCSERPPYIRHKQDWCRGFILLLPQAAALPGPDAGSDVVKPASSFII